MEDFFFSHCTMKQWYSIPTCIHGFSDLWWVWTRIGHAVANILAIEGPSQSHTFTPACYEELLFLSFLWFHTTFIVIPHHNSLFLSAIIRRKRLLDLFWLNEYWIFQWECCAIQIYWIFQWRHLEGYNINILCLALMVVWMILIFNHNFKPLCFKSLTYGFFFFFF